jgi:glycosyltransferase involved in cell wall biosynthesis
MLIGIEAQRANLGQKTGVEHYAKQLILHLAKIDTTNSYILYLRSKPEAWFLDLPKNFQVKVMPFPIFWTQLRISWEMLINPVDVLLILASALPFFHPKKSIVVVHDLAWRYFPKSFTWFMRNFLEWSTWFAQKRAKKIIAVSESTKEDLVKFYKVDEKKIHVVHHGYEEQVSGSRLKLSDELQKKLPEKYVLFLSTIQPRKNLQGLIDAFVWLKRTNPQLVHKLVVIGKLGWKFDSILNKIKQHSNLVVYLNYLNNEESNQILKKADLLVLPSFYEGFGMTILEAFAANVPVATSKISSMPEVAEQAAVYFNPFDSKDMALAIQKVLTDKLLVDDLRHKGRERLKNFSWEKCAKETLSIIYSL